VGGSVGIVIGGVTRRVPVASTKKKKALFVIDEQGFEIWAADFPHRVNGSTLDRNRWLPFQQSSEELQAATARISYAPTVLRLSPIGERWIILPSQDSLAEN